MFVWQLTGRADGHQEGDLYESALRSKRSRFGLPITETNLLVGVRRWSKVAVNFLLHHHFCFLGEILCNSTAVFDSLQDNDLVALAGGHDRIGKEKAHVFFSALLCFAWGFQMKYSIIIWLCKWKWLSVQTDHEQVGDLYLCFTLFVNPLLTSAFSFLFCFALKVGQWIRGCFLSPFQSKPRSLAARTNLQPPGKLIELSKGLH